MIVCLCHGVSERVIDECIDAGASTVTEVGLMSGAGMSCGSCRCTIEDRIACAAGMNDASSSAHCRTGAASSGDYSYASEAPSQAQCRTGAAPSDGYSYTSDASSPAHGRTGAAPSYAHGRSSLPIYGDARSAA